MVAYIEEIVLSFGIVAVCVAGDTFLQSQSKLPKDDQNLFINCIVDNSVHGLVGLLSWTIVILGDNSLGQVVGFDYRILETVACGVIASLIDLDHFWHAGVLNLRVNKPTIINTN